MDNYDPKTIEKKWNKVWDPGSKATDFDKRPKYYAMAEFPYPSGEGLHMGHAWTYMISDVFARKKRMEGFNVLFPMGWDAFGLPTENFAIKTKQQPAVVTKRNTDHFREQMQALGLSFNWDREVNTSDPNYYKWTQWIFIQLFKNGLAYKAETPVNWCPSCKVVLALEEVVDGRHERCGTVVSERLQSQWVLRITSYADRLADELDLVAWPEHIKIAQRNWIGRKDGEKIKFGSDQIGVGEIEVFTTRPDTILGATFVALSPNHPLVGKVKTVINPANGREIPVFVDEYVLDTVGTGAIMGVPGYDERDRVFAEKMGLPVVKEELTDKKFGTKTAIYHIRDWIFSRQHYWGEPTPMIYCQKCANDGVSFWDTAEGKKTKPLFDPQKPEQFDNLGKKVDLAGWFPDENLPVTLPEVEHYEPTETGESPLAKMIDWVKVPCPNCGGEARRETDVMPNWAGSSWYFLRYIDPTNNQVLADPKKLEYWMPVDYYFGGAEHTTLHLLYSRFWHKFLNDIKVAPGKEPYKQRINHGIILASDGSKMSKSKGNVVNPDEIVNKYGADPVRVYMAFMGPFEQTMPWNEVGVEGAIRFLNRVWKIYTEKKRIGQLTTPKLAEKLAWATARVTSGIDSLRPNVAIAAMMEFLNAWEDEGQHLSLTDAESFLKLLAPFAPHLTEEIWNQLGNKGTIHIEAWPIFEDGFSRQEITLVVSVNGRPYGELKISTANPEMLNQDRLIAMAQKLDRVAAQLNDKQVKKTIYVPNKVVNFVV